MIQSNELRKGNKIIANGLHGGRIMTVDRLADKGTLSEENRPVMFEEYEVGEFLKDCKGIPLSPKILEACGYKKLGDRYFNQEADIGVIGWVRPGEYCLSSIPIISPNIKYLHQLQNLFFALKGQELTINLEKVKV